MRQKLEEECGIFGIFKDASSITITYKALLQLQHRGQEASGIAGLDGGNFKIFKNIGLVKNVFNKEILKKLKSQSAIGHNRYCISATNTVENAQPLIFANSGTTFAIAHNGMINNAQEIYDFTSYTPKTTSDSEAIGALIEFYLRDCDFLDAIRQSICRLKGAFSVVILSEDGLFGFKDRFSFRPLSLGMINNSYALSSESCVFSERNSRLLKELEAGEIIHIDGKLNSYKMDGTRRKICAFEFIYFAKEESEIYKKNIKEIRKKLGEKLSKIYPLEADFIIGVDASGTTSAKSYAKARKIPYLPAIKKTKNLRSFIDENPKNILNSKFSFDTSKIEGKRLIIIDDSIVRGNTMQLIVEKFKKASEIIVLLSSPKILQSCDYGINLSGLFVKKLKINDQKTIEKAMAEALEISKIGFLKIGDLEEILGKDICTECLGEK